MATDINELITIYDILLQATFPASLNLSLLRFARNDGEEPHTAHAFRRLLFISNMFL